MYINLKYDIVENQIGVWLSIKNIIMKKNYSMKILFEYWSAKVFYRFIIKFKIVKLKFKTATGRASQGGKVLIFVNWLWTTNVN